MSLLINLLAGALFAVGLLIGGMGDPAKIQNFLDLTGTWDPSLIFVMGGAVVTTFIGYRLAFARKKPLLAPKFQLPTATALDRRILIGPAVFGIGWGLAGYCPGPALTGLAQGAAGTLVFVAAMACGMALARIASR
jgi:uncharacterized membrane protein YedE/YeeE